MIEVCATFIISNFTLGVILLQNLLRFLDGIDVLPVQTAKIVMKRFAPLYSNIHAGGELVLHLQESCYI